MLTQDKYSWYPLKPFAPEQYEQVKEAYHIAIQNVASVGRTYIEEVQEEDGNARLSWVPGLWRMAGMWVEGINKFRSSLSFKDANIYLVDPKLNTLAKFDLKSQSYRQAMIWLEDQIIQQSLNTANLSTQLPYELPRYAADRNLIFEGPILSHGEQFGGFYHDAFILFSQLKEEFPNTSEISIYPHHFDIEVKVILKKTDELATDTFVRVGFSPGDTSTSFPYFYINSWPNITDNKLPKAPLESYWNTSDWNGLVLKVEEVYALEDQMDYLRRFMSEGISIFTHLLLD